MNLWETDLLTLETKMAIKLDAGYVSLAWDKKMENLYLLSDGRVSKLDLSAGSSTGIEISGEMTYDEVNPTCQERVFPGSEARF